MASTAKIDPPTDSTPAADPFAWDPDPMVLVSRRNRVIVVPTDVLRGEMTPEQVKRWSAPISEIGQVGSRQERQIAFVAGVNFLGAHTSVWALRGTASSRVAPQGPPPVDQRKIVWPHTNGADLVTGPYSGNVDPDTQRVRPDKVHAVLLRVLDFHKAHVEPRTWETPGGFDAPEFVLLRLSDLFRQNSREAASASSAAITAMRFLRRTTDVYAHLGALHDYAVRDGHGAAMLNACRQWATAKKI